MNCTATVTHSLHTVHCTRQTQAIRKKKTIGKYTTESNEMLMRSFLLFWFFFCYFSALFLFFLLRWPFIRAMSHHILSHHLLRCNLAYCGLTAFTVLHTIPTGLCVHHFYVIISIRRLSKLHVEPIWRWFRVHYRTRCPNRIVLPGEAMCKCAVNALLSTARQQSNKRDDDVGFQFSLCFSLNRSVFIIIWFGLVCPFSFYFIIFFSLHILHVFYVILCCFNADESLRFMMCMTCSCFEKCTCNAATVNVPIHVFFFLFLSLVFPLFSVGTHSKHIHALF